MITVRQLHDAVMNCVEMMDLANGDDDSRAEYTICRAACDLAVLAERIAGERNVSDATRAILRKQTEGLQKRSMKLARAENAAYRKRMRAMRQSLRQNTPGDGA